MTEGKSAGSLVELHRGDAEVEYHAIDLLMSGALRDSFQVREFALAENEPPIGSAGELGSARDSMGITIDRYDGRAGCGEDLAAVTAGSKRRINVDPTIADVQIPGRRAAEHGNVTSRSASDSRLAVAARHHSRAPCGSSAATRVPSCLLSARTFSVASASSARKRPGSQI